MTRSAVLLSAGIAALALTGPAAAQSPRDAALANSRIALHVCLDLYSDADSRVAALSAAGFSYTTHARPGDPRAYHKFSDPAGIVSIMTYGTDGDDFCAISSDVLNVTEAVQFVEQTTSELFPGMFTYGQMQGGAAITPTHPQAANFPCTGYSAFFPRRAIDISIGIAGQDPICVMDGTSQIMVRM
ncbi:hypothetical protein ACRARG_08475 [Pseudooceanicola sp. C21-150M6]|uniref:hypothetical protein n=1 Tax=Pseudooceanicola sp. C21-150M6 TaxID=3434355 RepID=UPI003D7FFC97